MDQSKEPNKLPVKLKQPTSLAYVLPYEIRRSVHPLLICLVAIAVAALLFLPGILEDEPNKRLNGVLTLGIFVIVVVGVFIWTYFSKVILGDRGISVLTPFSKKYMSYADMIYVDKSVYAGSKYAMVMDTYLEFSSPHDKLTIKSSIITQQNLRILFDVVSRNAPNCRFSQAILSQLHSSLS